MTAQSTPQRVEWAPMRRRILSSASLLSLLLCLATAVLWVRSYWFGDIWELSRLIRQNHPASGEDEYRYLRIAVVGGYCATEYGQQSAVHGFKVKPLFHVGGPLPPGATSHASDQIGGIESPPFSLATPTLLFAILPGLWVVLRKRDRNRNHACCRKCGYNLTGNTSGVCPECGTAVAGNAGA